MIRRTFLLLVLLAATAQAATLVEDFEDEIITGPLADPTPTESWYTFSGAGAVQAQGLDGTGQAYYVTNNGSTTGRQATFVLGTGAQVDSIEFEVSGLGPSQIDGGSRSMIRLESMAPVRALVEIHIHCTEPNGTDFCQLRVRHDNVNTTGDIIVDYDLNQTEFNVRIVPDWLNDEFTLYVDGSDDGTTTFLQIPQTFNRFSIHKPTGTYPLGLIFDEIIILGGVDATSEAVQGDFANYVTNHANDTGFNNEASLFFFGLVLLVTFLMAAWLVLRSMVNKTTVGVLVAINGIAITVWLVFVGIWPDWVGISLIIACSAVISFALRTALVSSGQSGTETATVVSALGYFLIASVLLALSGYASSTISLPASPGVNQDAGATTEDTQRVLVNCTMRSLFTCAKTVVQETSAAIGSITAWAIDAFTFLFQLLTFRLPIPTWANVIIVSPPAVTLAFVGLKTIRGTS